MKIPFMRAHVFWTPWWDVDHHMYGCPIELIMHTPRRVFMVRPFSAFSNWDGTASKWWLRDNTPEKYAEVGKHHHRYRYCVWCLHDEETCRLCGGHDGKVGRSLQPERHVRHGAFLWHLWLMHIRESNHCGWDR